MRTFALVSLGACFFVVIMGSAASGSTDPLLFDQMRTLAGLVVGIGFLGGGAILHNHDHASGLTTAAGLWVAAAIGAAVGYGLVSLAVFVTILTLVVFTFFYFLEHKVFKAHNE
jgi:putative Mg2+ transporter-C (MgtC) family protein